MKYIVHINKPEGQEDFEKQRDNVAYVVIKAKIDQKILSPCTIQLELSKDGMLGFGKELIRYADGEMGGPFHADKMDALCGATSTFGIYLVPESVDAVIGGDDLKTIDQYLAKTKVDYDL